MQADDEITSARSDISTTLNNAVKELKEFFNKTAEDINKNADTIETIDDKVQKLIEDTAESETNPNILFHGRTALPSQDCDEKTQTLRWTGSKWECITINILSDCNPADDEYRVETEDGHECRKYDLGKSINYYWEFSGYSPKCELTDGQNAKVYNCYYKNKLGAEVQVDDANCSNKTKPTAKDNTCVAAFSYKCSSGVLDGNKCKESRSVYKYDDSNYCYQRKSHNCNGGEYGSGCYINGKISYRTPRGAFVEKSRSSKCAGDDGSRWYEYYKVKVEEELITDAIKTCPTGYTLTPDATKCYK